MRILQTLYHCKSGGGSLQVMLDLATAAQNSGYQVDLLGPADLSVSEASKPFFTGNKLRDWLALWRWLRHGSYDLVHVHDRYCSLLLRGIPYRPPSLQTNHTIYSSRRRLTLFADRVVACSSTMDKHHATYFHLPSFRRNYIPNGVHVPQPNSCQLIKIKSQLKPYVGKRLVCLTVARLSPQKGHHYLLEAISQLHQTIRRQWLFVFAGDGEFRPELERKATTLQVQDSIIWLGHTTHVAEWLTLADAFVLPSLFEGLPLSLLEAMAVGLPCLTTAVDGNLDVIIHKQNGYLVSAANSTDLCLGLQEFLSDSSLRQKIRSQAQKDYLRYWSFQRTWQQYESLYLELVYGSPICEDSHASSIAKA